MADVADDTVPTDGGAEDDLDLSKVIEDIEATEAATLATKAATQADEGEGKGKGGGTPRAAADPDDPLNKFVADNYQGNREAAVAGFYESRVESRRLAQEMETLRQEVAKATPPPPTRDLAAELEDLRKTDPDVVALNREITNTDQRSKAITARQVALVAAANRLDTEIVTLEAELQQLSDDPKAFNLKFIEANRKRSERVAVTNEYDTNELRLEKNSDKQTNDRRELRRAEQALEAQLVEEVNQAKVNEKGGIVTRRTFDAAFDYYTEPFKVDRKAKQGQVAYSAVKAMVADHLDALGAESDGLDAHGIFEVVKGLVADYAEANSWQQSKAGAPPSPKGGSPSAVRRILTPTPPKGARADAAALRTKASDAVLSDPDAVRRRAAAIDAALSARQRAAAR